MNNTPSHNPVELICLRQLQQGRGTCSDGRDPARMVVGVIATALVFTLMVLSGAPFWLSLLVSFGGIAATVTWISVAGQRVRERWIAEIEQRYPRKP